MSNKKKLKRKTIVYLCMQKCEEKKNYFYELMFGERNEYVEIHQFIDIKLMMRLFNRKF